MQIERTRLYRVKAVAAILDVSPATIYRAIESGALPALKLGTGNGTLRVSESDLTQYVQSCAQAAAAGWLDAAERVHAAVHEGGDAA